MDCLYRENHMFDHEQKSNRKNQAVVQKGEEA